MFAQFRRVLSGSASLSGMCSCWAVCWLLCSTASGSYGLYEPHEGHFAGVGREMVLSGDWITPRLDGAPYLNKPPLFYWMIATSYSIFGINEFARMAAAGVDRMGGVCLAWQWAGELWGGRAGRAAAGILGISAGWYLFSHQLLIDELLCTLYLASLYFLWKGIVERGRSRGWIGFSCHDRFVHPI